MLSGVWPVALTVVFAATGLYNLWRLATARSQGFETVVDVNHVVMSPAMVVMLWWPSATGARWPQVVVFGAMALVFFHRLSGSDTVPTRAGELMHAAMNLGMVWMLITMPALMPAVMDMPAMAMVHEHRRGSINDLTGLHAWAALLSWVVAGLLALATLWWAVRVARAPGHRLACSCHGLSCAGIAAMLALMTPAL
ncbi:DUF5134 domain-containing protein [Kribbella sp. NPDC051952]|uniref:DUF5134 domain-containing protein n=1 Tax=Kribbella sp. NPDC051952 TaxID=3154851 RepID=UPI00342B9915